MSSQDHSDGGGCGSSGGEGGRGGSGSQPATAEAAGSPGRLQLTMKLQPAAPPPAPLSQSPQQPQSPHNPRDRRGLRRGNSPLTVLIDPPSMENDASPTSATRRDEISRVDSLSMALEELRAKTSGGRPTTNFFEAHERANRSSDASSSVDVNADVGAAFAARSDDDFLSVRPAAKRSSSLKSKKTPPGTPSQVKKAVRFADAFGLDLANVKHVLDPDNPPVIPPQATRDLELGDAADDYDYDDDDDDDDGNEASYGGRQRRRRRDLSTVASCSDGDDNSSGSAAFDAASSSGVPPPPPLLVARPAFSQPGHSAGFAARVMAQKVVLESAGFAPPDAIHGFVRVANLAFEKSVSLRATFDAWRSSVTVQAAYVADSSSGMTDQFQFRLALPASCLQQPGASRVAFCVAYSTGGQTYWDNNFGDNYAFDCVPAPAADAWGRRF